MGQFLQLDGSGNFLSAEEIPEMPFKQFLPERDGIKERMDVTEIPVLTEPHVSSSP